MFVGAAVALPAAAVDVLPTPPMPPAVAVASAVGVPVAQDVALGDGDALASGLAVAELAGDGERATRVPVGVGDDVGDGVGDGVGVSVGVGDGVSVGEGDVVVDALPVGRAVAARVVVASGVLVIVAHDACPGSTWPQAATADASYCPLTVMP